MSLVGLDSFPACDPVSGQPMFKFFYGWRRKLGVISLVIACALAGLWVRSRAISDQLDFNRVLLVSADGEIIIARRPGPDDRLQLLPGYGSVDTQYIRRDLTRETWKWRAFGFRYGGSELMTFWISPYWSIAIPLTLLSCLLLLSKPRTRRPGNAENATVNDA